MRLAKDQRSFTLRSELRQNSYLSVPNKAGRKEENQIFNGDGFEKNVDAVTKLEQELGI